MSTLFNVSDYFSLIIPKPVLKRGNPNFKAKYSDKTKVIRVPEYLIPDVKKFVELKDNQRSLNLPENEPITQNEPVNVLNTVTQIDQDDYKIAILG